MVDFSKITKESMEESNKLREEIERLRNDTCGFTGHRPSKLDNCYSLKHPMSIKISDEIYPILEKLIKEEGIRRFITGGAIGFDQIAFWTVHKLKKTYPDIKNVLSIPFKNQAAKWTDKETLTWYSKMLKLADEIIYVDELGMYRVEGTIIGDYHVAKMQQRNEHMVDESRIMIALWDGTKGGTGNCVNYIRKKSKTLYWINPKNNFELEVRYGMNG